jgi:uncharacterized membrane protein
MVLPSLALLIFAGCGVMAWLIFRPPAIRKARPDPTVIAARQKPKKRAL